MSDSKTGKQIVNDFIQSLQTNSDLSQDVVHIIKTLHENDELTYKKIDDELKKLRDVLLDETEESNS